MKTILLDMDNTLFDFSGAIANPEAYGPPEMLDEGFFEHLEPLGPAKKVVDFLHQRGYKLYICTRPLYSSPKSFTEKVKSVQKHFPYLWDRIIMIKDKNMLNADWLIDDHAYNDSGKYNFFLFNYHKPLHNWKEFLHLLGEDSSWL